MVVEVSDIVTINFVLVKEKDILHAGSEKEADEIMMMLQSSNPQEKYCILEMHPLKPKGLGRDPDLH